MSKHLMYASYPMVHIDMYMMHTSGHVHGITSFLQHDIVAKISIADAATVLRALQGNSSSSRPSLGLSVLDILKVTIESTTAAVVV
jgi:hypothetical protein